MGYLPLSFIHSFIDSLAMFNSYQTILSRLCFAKHNAAHHHERTMPHTMFNNLDDLNLNNLKELKDLNDLNNLNNLANLNNLNNLDNLNNLNNLDDLNNLL